MSTEIIFDTQDHLGLVTLDRPQVLNALSLDMIKALQKQLLLWEKEDSIHAVIIQGKGERAFCAGGDVRWVYKAGLDKSPDQLQFFWHEYRLNHYIHRFSKPYLALMNGITMGGGVGISLHGSHPIATENFIFAMPETGIGFFPDIGSSYLLSRCPDSIGMYLGLTGNRLQAEDAYRLGLIKSIIPSESIKEVIKSLFEIDLTTNAKLKIDHCLEQFKLGVERGEIHEHQETIKHCFSQASVEDIFAALEKKDDNWSVEILKNLKKKSPLSLKVTFTQLQKARNMSMMECIFMDYCLVNQFLRDHDFYEGIRALLVDKDKNPHWQPDVLEKVTKTQVMNYFECTDQLILIT